MNTDTAQLNADCSQSNCLDHLRILVVDDVTAIHDDYRKILVRAQNSSLEKAGAELFGREADVNRKFHFELDSAYQGQEGLALVQKAIQSGRPYSLAFVDVRMPPGWDGVETIEQLWKVDPALQVVICTAYSDHSWHSIMKRLGDSDSLLILKKPFDPVEVLQLAHALTKKWLLNKQTRSHLAELEAKVEERTIELQNANSKLLQEIAQNKLTEEQKNLQFSALTAAANAIVITGRDGKIEWVNPSFTKLTGYSAEEAIGNSLGLMKSGHHPPEFFSDLWSTIAAGNVWHGEIVNKRKNGRLCTEDVTITPVRDSKGEIAHFVTIILDITEQRQFENRMQQAQKMEAIGRLAGGIAHDFNNMLAAIMGFSSLLQQDTQGNPSAQEDIAEILKAASRAKDLVQQILTFSRQREQKREIVQLNTIVRDATKFLRASVPATIDIELNLAEDTPPVLADPTQIYQVTINLANNALQAMEGRPGQLTIKLDSFLPGRKFIQEHPEFRPIQYVHMAVTDTGRGMDAETLRRIFEPFFTTKAIGKGTGLGLAVVHGIIESHEGIMTVESEVNKGTTFNLYLAAQTDTAMLSGKTDHNIAPGHGQKILLLDDEPALTASLQRLLKRMNYDVTVTNSPCAAITLFSESDHFDLVITDLSMPEMDGLDVARQLHVIRPGLPIILASGYSPTFKHDSLRSAGICELLEKPISLPQLAEVLERTFARRRQA